jgi:hypothetical protein
MHPRTPRSGRKTAGVGDTEPEAEHHAPRPENEERNGSLPCPNQGRARAKATRRKEEQPIRTAHVADRKYRSDVHEGRRSTECARRGGRRTAWTRTTLRLHHETALSARRTVHEERAPAAGATQSPQTRGMSPTGKTAQAVNLVASNARGRGARACRRMSSGVQTNDADEGGRKRL